jgi:hypothetical protein
MIQHRSILLGVFCISLSSFQYVEARGPGGTQSSVHAAIPKGNASSMGSNRPASPVGMYSGRASLSNSGASGMKPPQHGPQSPAWNANPPNFPPPQVLRYPGSKLDKIERHVDHREFKRDSIEQIHDRREDYRDRLENRRDLLEDRWDSQHQGGKRDQLEDIRDKQEDKFDRRENVRDHKEDHHDHRANHQVRHEVDRHK